MELTGPHIRLHPRSETQYVSRGLTVLATDRDGFIRKGSRSDHGLFVRETRLLSRYRYLIDGQDWRPVDSSSVRQHSWLGYYVAPAQYSAASKSPRLEADRYGIELRLIRLVGNGLVESIELTNHSQSLCHFRLGVEVDADFADMLEVKGDRQQCGHRDVSWLSVDQMPTLRFDYSAARAYENQDDRGHATFKAGLSIVVADSDAPPFFHNGRIEFDVTLKSHASWRASLRHVPWYQGQPLPQIYAIDSAFRFPGNEWDRRQRQAMEHFTRFTCPSSETMAPVAVAALNQALEDLASLRLNELDEGPCSWTTIAGLPGYVALFGRDTLWTGWQASLAGISMLDGSLSVHEARQGKRNATWYAERPGKILHEAHWGPLAELHYNNRLHSYSSITGGKFYCMALGELWRWTGDRDKVTSHLGAARKSLKWLLEEADRDEQGFFSYRRLSADGLKNQGWKDSADAIVDENGRIVPDPIAPCEEQGFAFQALRQVALVLWELDCLAEANDLTRLAEDLRCRINQNFWLDDLGFYAMALGPGGRRLRSVASNPGHLLATGAADRERGISVAERLMKADMFSGWGIRTLSADHPAYNPFGYHIGSVWPVENGAFSRGFSAYGATGSLHQLCKAQLDATMLFDFHRLPEDFSGHPRDDQHPFPSIYPDANWPQAWSCSAVLAHLRALLGLEPFASFGRLFVNPRLPSWLPELTVARMQVGDARVSLRFFRCADGSSSFEVTEQDGPLKVIRRDISFEALTLAPPFLADFLKD